MPPAADGWRCRPPGRDRSRRRVRGARKKVALEGPRAPARARRERTRGGRHTLVVGRVLGSPRGFWHLVRAVTPPPSRRGCQAERPASPATPEPTPLRMSATGGKAFLLAFVRETESSCSGEGEDPVTTDDEVGAIIDALRAPGASSAVSFTGDIRPRFGGPVARQMRRGRRAAGRRRRRPERRRRQYRRAGRRERLRGHRRAASGADPRGRQPGASRRSPVRPRRPAPAPAASFPTRRPLSAPSRTPSLPRPSTRRRAKCGLTTASRERTAGSTPASTSAVRPRDVARPRGGGRPGGLRFSGVQRDRQCSPPTSSPARSECSRATENPSNVMRVPIASPETAATGAARPRRPFPERRRADRPPRRRSVPLPAARPSGAPRGRPLRGRRRVLERDQADEEVEVDCRRRAGRRRGVLGRRWAGRLRLLNDGDSSHPDHDQPAVSATTTAPRPTTAFPRAGEILDPGVEDGNLRGWTCDGAARRSSGQPRRQGPARSRPHRAPPTTRPARRSCASLPTRLRVVGPVVGEHASSGARGWAPSTRATGSPRRPPPLSTAVTSGPTTSVAIGSTARAPRGRSTPTTRRSTDLPQSPSPEPSRGHGRPSGARSGAPERTGGS